MVRATSFAAMRQRLSPATTTYVRVVGDGPAGTGAGKDGAGAGAGGGTGAGAAIVVVGPGISGARTNGSSVAVVVVDVVDGAGAAEALTGASTMDAPRRDPGQPPHARRRPPHQPAQAVTLRPGAGGRAHDHAGEVPADQCHGECAGADLDQELAVGEEVLRHAGTLRDHLRMCQLVKK